VPRTTAKLGWVRREAETPAIACAYPEVNDGHYLTSVSETASMRFRRALENSLRQFSDLGGIVSALVFFPPALIVLGTVEGFALRASLILVALLLSICAYFPLAHFQRSFESNERRRAQRESSRRAAEELRLEELRAAAAKTRAAEYERSERHRAGEQLRRQQILDRLAELERLASLGQIQMSCPVSLTSGCRKQIVRQSHALRPLREMTSR
jgi:hypothetical protein